MGAAGSPGVSEHPVTFGDNQTPAGDHGIGSAIPESQAVLSRRRRSPFPFRWHLGSLPAAAGSNTHAGRAPPPVPKAFHHRCNEMLHNRPMCLCSPFPRSGVPAEPSPGLELLQGVFVCTHSDLVIAVSREETLLVFALPQAVRL